MSQDGTQDQNHYLYSTHLWIITKWHKLKSLVWKLFAINCFLYEYLQNYLMWQWKKMSSVSLGGPKTASVLN